MQFSQINAAAYVTARGGQPKDSSNFLELALPHSDVAFLDRSIVTASGIGGIDTGMDSSRSVKFSSTRLSLVVIRIQPCDDLGRHLLKGDIWSLGGDSDAEPKKISASSALSITKSQRSFLLYLASVIQARVCWSLDHSIL